MPTGQFFPGQILIEAPTTFDNFTTFNRGVKAGTGFGSPTIAVGAGAGAGTVGTHTGTDFAGNFNIQIAGSGSGAGTMATVTFANQLGAVPSSVVLNVADTTGATTIASGANQLAATGFSVITAAPVAQHIYNISYTVIQ